MLGSFRIGADGEAECYSTDGGETCASVCRTDTKEYTPPPGAQWTVLKCSRFGEKAYADPVSWCRIICQSSEGCAHKAVAERVPPPPPPRRARPPPPPPPAEIGGEGPCREDADCSVSNDHTCCGCETIVVRSRLHRREPEPACGCGYFGGIQALPPGDDGEESFGPCGRPPPGASEYRAVCRKNACVGVRK